VRCSCPPQSCSALCHDFRVCCRRNPCNSVCYPSCLLTRRAAAAQPPAIAPADTSALRTHNAGRLASTCACLAQTSADHRSAFGSRHLADRENRGNPQYAVKSRTVRNQSPTFPIIQYGVTVAMVTQRLTHKVASNSPIFVADSTS